MEVNSPFLLCVSLYFKAIFQVQAPRGLYLEGQFKGGFFALPVRGAYIWRGNLTEGFLRYRLGGLIFGGAYTWRGLFSEFYGIWDICNERFSLP